MTAAVFQSFCRANGRRSRSRPLRAFAAISGARNPKGGQEFRSAGTSPSGPFFIQSQVSVAADGSTPGILSHRGGRTLGKRRSPRADTAQQRTERAAADPHSCLSQSAAFCSKILCAADIELRAFSRGFLSGDRGFTTPTRRYDRPLWLRLCHAVPFCFSLLTRSKVVLACRRCFH